MYNDCESKTECCENELMPTKCLLSRGTLLTCSCVIVPQAAEYETTESGSGSRPDTREGVRQAGHLNRRNRFRSHAGVEEEEYERREMYDGDEVYQGLQVELEKEEEEGEGEEERLRVQDSWRGQERFFHVRQLCVQHVISHMDAINALPMVC